MTSKSAAAALPVKEPEAEGTLIEEMTVIEKVNKLHEEARKDAVKAVERAVECGEALIEIKLSMEHGKWTDWCAKNLNFSARTARLYMQAAKAAKDGLPFNSLKALYGPHTEVEGTERTPAEATRDKRDLSPLDAAIVDLNETLEKVVTPVMSAEEFIAEAGDDFLSDKAAEKLDWLVKLFDAVTNVDSLPGK